MTAGAIIFRFFLFFVCFFFPICFGLFCLFGAFVHSLVRSKSNFSSRRRDRFGPKILVVACACGWPHKKIFLITSKKLSHKSENSRTIARMGPMLTIFGPNRSRRRDLFFEKFSNERRRHRGIVVVVIVAVVVVGRFGVASITGPSLPFHETFGIHLVAAPDLVSFFSQQLRVVATLEQQ